MATATLALTHYWPWDADADPGEEGPAACGAAMTDARQHSAYPTCPTCAAALAAEDYCRRRSPTRSPRAPRRRCVAEVAAVARQTNAAAERRPSDARILSRSRLALQPDLPALRPVDQRGSPMTLMAFALVALSRRLILESHAEGFAMTLIARRPAKTYAQAPEGLFAAVCCDVQNLGLIAGAYGAKHKVRLVWQLDATSDDGRRYEVARVYTLSLHERATLRKDLESWRGRAFTEKELDGFDLEKLLTVNAQVQVVQKLGDDGTIYANVATVIPPSKGTAKLQPLDFVRLQDRAIHRNNGAPREMEPDEVPF